MNHKYAPCFFKSEKTIRNSDIYKWCFDLGEFNKNCYRQINNIFCWDECEYLFQIDLSGYYVDYINDNNALKNKLKQIVKRIFSTAGLSPKPMYISDEEYERLFI